MSRKQKITRGVIGLVLAALVGYGVWYSRPVDIYALMPGLEPETIEVRVFPDQRMSVCYLMDLTAEDPEFHEVLSRLEALRFRRSPLNPLGQATPLLSGLEWPKSRTPGPGDMESLEIRFTQPQETGPRKRGSIHFWVDTWGFRDLDHDGFLSFRMKDGKEIGQTLAHDLMELSIQKEAAP